MFRCPRCGKREHFYVRKAGYRVLVENDPLRFSSQYVTYQCRGSWDLHETNRYNHFKMVCKSCNFNDIVSVFKDAYANPIVYFDSDMLCDCGGEYCIDIAVRKEENQEPTEYIGSQKKVAMHVEQSLACEKCGKRIKRNA